MLREIGRDLWVAERPLSYWGAALGARMTVARLEDGGLWLHSPIDPEPALKAELDALGPVRCLVAPNLHHDRWLGAAQQAWPEARTWGPPGLAQQRADLRIDEELGDRAPDAWRHQIDQSHISGAPKLAETLFFHRASKSLLLTDLALNVVRAGWWTATALRFAGAYGRLATPRDVRGMLRDPVATRRALDRVLGWDFQRIVPCHGEILTDRAREQAAELFASL